METPLLPKGNQHPEPLPDITLKWHTPIQMRITDIDIQGHVNNNIYLSYMDLGKTAFFSGIMRRRISWSRIGLVIANLNCSFLAPTHFDEKIEVQTGCLEIGCRSLRLLQRVVNKETGEVKAECRCVMVGFDETTGRSSDLAIELIEDLEKFEGRPLRDCPDLE